MADKIFWFFLFVALYWAFSIFRSARIARTDRAAGGGRRSVWIFALAATAVSLSGWALAGHPGLYSRDGFAYGFVSLCAVTIPISGALFFKRQWMLGRRFGYATPGEMLADYFRGDAIRILTVVVAVAVSVPIVAVQLGAAGYLFDALTGGLVDRRLGIWIVALVVLASLAAGGLRGVASAGVFPGVLLALGMVLTGAAALAAAGGWGELQVGLAKLAVSDLGRWGTTEGRGGGDYNAYFAVPGVIQFTAGLGKELPAGGGWTGVMILTFMFATMGIMSSPAFSVWALKADDPRPFAPQQVWTSAFAFGAVLVFFSAFQAMGAHFLDFGAKAPDALVPGYIDLLADSYPWLAGLLAICALAVIQAASAVFLASAATMLSRDIYKRYLRPAAANTAEKMFAHFSVVVVLILAVAVAASSTDALVFLGGLAIAFGFQMWPSLAAVCWFPWLTRQGVTWGLAAGLLGVIFTESLGATITGGALPWGRWPLTIHSAGWGMIVNLSVCLFVSAMTQNEHEQAHRMKYHDFLREHASLSPEKKGLKPIAWIVTLAWLFFGVGPGAVIGNDIFGSPNAGTPDAWTFGMPSIWAWQVLFWVLGVAMLWFLAYKMEMSTLPDKEVVALAEDIGDTTLETPGN